jgi:hypothetical protein
MAIRDLKLPETESAQVEAILERAVEIGALSKNDKSIAALNLRAIHKHLCPMDLDLMQIASAEALQNDFYLILHNFDPAKGTWILKTQSQLPACRKRKAFK